jgi:hypothetical protein
MLLTVAASADDLPSLLRCAKTLSMPSISAMAHFLVARAAVDLAAAPMRVRVTKSEAPAGPFLPSKGGPPEDVDRMQDAWRKCVLLQLAL